MALQVTKWGSPGGTWLTNDGTNPLAQVIKMGEAVGAPWRYTHVCSTGGIKHCGKCPKCLERKEAFHQAGVEEPAGLYAASQIQL